VIGLPPPGTARRAGRGHAVRIPGGKTAVPELPAEYVPRPALLDRLDAAGAAQLVVVSAPAGYGKTLLLADWVRNRAAADTAWVSVDADDDDPGRFWSAVLAALAALPSLPADSAVRRAVQPDGPGHKVPDGDVLDWLGEALDVVDPPVRLVLDDLQELTAQRPLRELARLVARRPAGLRLVLSSRVDPPLALPRLRLEGRLHEIRAEQLRFGVADTVTLLRSAGLDLAPAEVALLQARTDGWVAALRLAALALGRSEDPAAFLVQFSGDERSIADYLTGEILSGLADDAQDFLRAVSVCSVLPTALAVSLSGRPDAGHLLDEMGHETALVERAGPGEHRIHALLRSYLRANLHRHRPALHQRLQTVAACWWAERGEHVHALRHAERAGDEKRLAQLLRRSAVPLLIGADLTPLRRALTAVGPTARGADPWLSLVSAITHLDERAFAAAAVDLQHARLTWPSTPDRELEVLRSTAELLAPGTHTQDAAVPPLSDYGPPDVRQELTALLHLSRAAAELFPDGHGDLDVALAQLKECSLLATAHDLGRVEVQSSTLVATVATLRCDHRGMVAAAEEASAAALRHNLHPSRWSACATGMLAYADLLEGDPAGARARVDGALAAPDAIPPEAAYALRAVRGAALADEGERDRGAAELRTARRELGDAQAPRVLCAALGALEHRTTLLQGNIPAAAGILEWLEDRVGRPGEVLLLQAWTDTVAGRHEAARAVVDPVRAFTVPVLLPHTLLEVHLLDVEAALDSGDDAGARAALGAALAAAGAIGVVRPFALAGPRTLRLLADRTRPTGSRELEARLTTLAVCAEPAAVLSERELVVLGLLPSLRGAGEIATELTVSVNTVKSHIRSIYAKLEVSTRREAVQRASERGLLP
jgi:LuxR family maltose regulon positive regulatory protein